MLETLCVAVKHKINLQKTNKKAARNQLSEISTHRAKINAFEFRSGWSVQIKIVFVNDFVHHFNCNTFVQFIFC